MIAEFLKGQGKIITQDIKRLLGHYGFSKSDSDNSPDNEQVANTILNSYQSPSWTSDLTSLLQDFFIKIYIDSNEQASAEMGFEVDPLFHEYANEYAEERTAELVNGLDDSTQKMLKNDLIDSMNQRLTPAEIADKLEENYAFSDTRAMTIARTETANAWNHAGITTYRLGGAKAVVVFDGDHDKECQEADGQTWTFEYALEHRIEHPNCVRSFGSQMEDVEPDKG